MVPLVNPENLSRFVVIDQPNVECFFCNPAEMHRTVEVRLFEGVEAEWLEGPVLVRGRFSAGDKEGEIAIYRLHALEVAPVEDPVR